MFVDKERSVFGNETMKVKVLSNAGGISVMDHLFGCTKSCIRGPKLNIFSDVEIWRLFLVNLMKNIISFIL